MQTHQAGHAKELAQEVTEGGSDYLIAVGEDGTVLNGMMRTNIPSNKYPILGVLPRGSANDFVKTTGSVSKALKLYNILLDRSHQKIDIGKITSSDKSKSTRYFINIASLGLGPEVVKLMEGKSKILGSSVAYFFSILKGFSSYKKRHVLCEADDWKWEGDLLQMAIANARYFAHGLCVTPESTINDGMFQVALFGKFSLLDYLKNLNNLKKGKRIDHSGAHYISTSGIIITPQRNDSCGIEADGEYVGNLLSTSQ